METIHASVIIGKAPIPREEYREKQVDQVRLLVKAKGVVGLIDSVNKVTEILYDKNRHVQDADILADVIRDWLDEHYPLVKR